MEELRQQNPDLLRTLDELRQRQEELARLNRELEDTNRGVVALYAELDERADHLRRADEVKTRFLSNMTHEFRTPLNSILALTRLLLERVDGDLTRGAGTAGLFHPQIGGESLGAGERSAGPGQGGSRQDRGPAGRIRGAQPVRRACAACCARCC